MKRPLSAPVPVPAQRSGLGLAFQLVVVTLGMTATTAIAATGSHAEYFEHYQGTATCLECHEEEAKAFVTSQHYQWRGQTPELVNAHGQALGKMEMINDFCTNPRPSWIGEVVNAEGKVLAKGCSACHAGLGKIPGTKPTREELLNVDCLICHASGYTRSVYRTAAGGWEWRPVLWNNPEGLDSVSKRISMPQRKMCLRCHNASGGGANYKRGDLEYDLADPEPEFDVHMGNGMECVTCHAGADHRVLGRGVDLPATDSPGTRLGCSQAKCHDAAPHAKSLLNRHVARVACATCHVPDFARSEPTDMARDWSQITFSEERGRYSATIELASNVVPSYAWSNGSSWMQLPGQPVQRNADGMVPMAVPQGSRQDEHSQIAPFKVHRGRLPILAEKGWLLPIQVDETYVTGAVDPAVKEAAHQYYGLDNVTYTWADTVRYMGISHGVRPAKQALGCLDCHGEGGRMDWKGLGYAADPLLAVIGK
jgi:hypothetical protein